jgi:hypothetical protein
MSTAFIFMTIFFTASTRISDFSSKYFEQGNKKNNHIGILRNIM